MKISHLLTTKKNTIKKKHLPWQWKLKSLSCISLHLIVEWLFAPLALEIVPQNKNKMCLTFEMRFEKRFRHEAICLLLSTTMISLKESWTPISYEISKGINFQAISWAITGERIATQQLLEMTIASHLILLFAL